MTDRDDQAPTPGGTLERLRAWRPFTAVVVGDFMLDELVYGDVDRMSPDAPAPVLRVRKREHRAGGSGNLCLALAALGANVRAIGLVGDDAAGAALRAALAAGQPEAGAPAGAIDAEGLIADSDRPTTVKQSLVGLAQGRHAQKMFRVDTESTDGASGAVEMRLLTAFKKAIAGADVVIIEDYGKGAVTDTVSLGVIAAAGSTPVIVDPAPIENYARYRGATGITPNRREAERATGLGTGPTLGDEANATVGRAIAERFGIEHVVLTLDKHGALLVNNDSTPIAIPTVAREVYDVTGAGDVMAAGIAAGVANGLAWPDAVELGNAAAGLEVEHFGVRPIPIDAVRHELARRAGAGGIGKLMTPIEAANAAAAARSAGKRVVFTNGCFDVIHAGHATLLDAARSEGDVLLVGLNSDASVRRLKGAERPVNVEHDRATVLAGFASVDGVVLFGDGDDGDEPIRLLETIRPDVVVKGGDYTPDQVVGGEMVRAWGGRVVVTPEVSGRSSTRMIERIRGATTA